MPTIIRQSRSTEDINDVLSVRHQLLEESGWEIDAFTKVSGRVVDPLDLYPDTVNLVAYRDGKTVGTLRVLAFRAGDPLLRSAYDFGDAFKQVPSPVFFADWMGVVSGTPDASLILKRMLEFGFLLLARKGVKTLLGVFPASFIRGLKEPLRMDFLLQEPIITRGGMVIPAAANLESFYEHWVSTIQDREILRFQDLFYYTIFEPGEVLFVQGERGSTAYLLQEGEVEILLQKDRQIIPLAKVQKSQLIGEIAMITQEPRTASLVARSVTTCITLERQGFLQALENQPHLSMDIFKIFSKRIADANRKFAEANRE